MFPVTFLIAALFRYSRPRNPLISPWKQTLDKILASGYDVVSLASLNLGPSEPKKRRSSLLSALSHTAFHSIHALLSWVLPEEPEHKTKEEKPQSPRSFHSFHSVNSFESMHSIVSKDENEPEQPQADVAVKPDGDGKGVLGDDLSDNDKGVSGKDLSDKKDAPKVDPEEVEVHIDDPKPPNSKKKLQKKDQKKVNFEHVKNVPTPAKGKKKPCANCMLPWWAVIFAWFLVVAVTGVCSFFTILYTLNYGLDLSLQWLKSLITSWVTDMLMSQPMSVVMLAAFISLIIKKPEVIPTQKLDLEEEGKG